MTSGQFWSWFVAHEPQLWAIADRDSEILEELRAALSAYRRGLCLEVSDEERGARELIISAAGDRTLFAAVEALVTEAPGLTRWRFTALKPPRGFGFVLNTRELRLDPKVMVFEPLSNDEDPHALGLRVFVPQATGSAELQEAVSRVVETGIGERALSAIQHIEVASLEGPASEHIPLTDLPAYLDWFARKSSSG